MRRDARTTRLATAATAAPCATTAHRRGYGCACPHCCGGAAVTKCVDHLHDGIAHGSQIRIHVRGLFSFATLLLPQQETGSFAKEWSRAEALATKRRATRSRAGAGALPTKRRAERRGCLPPRGQGLATPRQHQSLNLWRLHPAQEQRAVSRSTSL